MADQSEKIEVIAGNDIFEYQFESFDNSPVTKPGEEIITEYELPEVDARDGIAEIEYQEIISRERKVATEKNFVVSPIVREFRGIKEQELQEKQKLVDEKVSKRVLRLKEKAYKEGYEEGMKQGRQEVYEETKKETEDKLEILLEMITATMSSQKEIISKQKTEIYTMIRNLTKWIVLRELSEDGEYINRLLEKLLQELDEKSNILVQVNKNDFEKMPEVLEVVEKKIGRLKNVRIETDYDIIDHGIVVEAESGIVNGTLEQQFSKLDKLFETVGVPGSSFNKVNIYEREIDLQEDHLRDEETQEAKVNDEDVANEIVEEVTEVETSEDEVIAAAEAAEEEAAGEETSEAEESASEDSDSPTDDDGPKGGDDNEE